MTLLHDWEEFELNVIPADFGREQRIKAKFAFYTGITTIRDRILEQTGTIPVDFMRTLSIETQELATSIRFPLEIHVTTYERIEQLLQRVEALEASVQEARAILAPLAPCDPAIRAWLAASNRRGTHGSG